MLRPTTLTFLSLLSLTTAQQTTNCTVFNWDNETPYLTTYAPQRVSGATSCPSSDSDSSDRNHTCALTASGDAQYSATSNITSLNLDTFVELIGTAVENSTFAAPDFNSTVIGSIDTTRMINAGQSAYLNFTGYKFCYQGSVGNCTDGVEDGAPLTICAPVWHGDGEASVLDGEYTVVNVSREDVGDYEDPYANQQGDEPGEGGAVGLEAGLNGGLLAVLVSMVAVLVV
ncbi:hypothetical protein BDV06DRAFT_224652 [Aspergillus oleicola]